MRGGCVENVTAGLVDGDVGVPDRSPLLTVRFATVEREDVAGDDTTERVGNPKSLATAAGNRVSIERTELAAPFDRDAAGAIVTDDVVSREDVAAALEKVAAHLRSVDAVVVELPPTAEVKVGAV